MLRPRACWYGRPDEEGAAETAPEPDLARVPKSVTLLGATGSIGSSTIDLLQREPGRYRVEAVTANRNAAALAKLARELGARFAAVGEPAAYEELKSALSGSGIEAAAGADALVEAAQRPAEWVMAAITGAASLKPTLAAAERGATVALANKECLVCAGALVHAPRGGGGRDGAAGRFRAQRDVPGDDVGPARGSAPRHPDRFRRAVPHLVARSNCAR